MRYRIYVALLGILGAGIAFSGVVQADLMDTIFQPSKNLEQVINIGNNPRSVGNTIFRGGITIGMDGTSERAPLLVTIAQTLLRLVVILAIPVLIYIGIKIIYGVTQGKSVQDGLKEVGSVLIGLIIALSAVGIIYLVQSLAARSLVGM